MPKGERPPPFLPPPTSVGCGGDSFGDPSPIQRMMRRLTDVVKKVSVLDRWSIDCIGIEHELKARYKHVIEAVNVAKVVDISVVTEAYVSAQRKLEQLEIAFFEGEGREDLIWMSIGGGWIGSADPETTKTLSAVRSSLLSIYQEVRKRLDHPPSNWQLFIEDIHRRVDVQLERLFTIRGADEITWYWVMSDIADSGRAIKSRVNDMAKTLSLD